MDIETAFKKALDKVLSIAPDISAGHVAVIAAHDQFEKASRKGSRWLDPRFDKEGPLYAFKLIVECLEINNRLCRQAPAF